ncbi:hypothetical protein AAVH_25747 [Aphelenchoides avenae]|nr:hypothetical protein AAVH_25747 [Aphelenchus avenae]
MDRVRSRHYGFRSDSRLKILQGGFQEENLRLRKPVRPLHYSNSRERSCSIPGGGQNTERTASLELTSCESGAHLSQLEVEAFKALEEMIRFVKTVNFSEVLARTPELIFLNLVTLEDLSQSYTG